MNGYGYYGDESLESLAEVLEDIGDDESDDDEARRRGRRGGRSSRRSGGRSALQPRSQSGGGNYVSRAEFDSAMAKTHAAIARQTAEYKKQSEAMKMFAILPLLQRPTTVPASATGTLPPNTQVQVASNDSLSSILPLLLISGMGSSGSGGGMFGGGSNSSDSSMMMMVLVLALSKR